MKKLAILGTLAVTLAACGGPNPKCSYNADGIKVEGYSTDSCAKLDLEYRSKS